MNFHWMPNIWDKGPLSPKDINKLLVDLDHFGYESIMMSFRPSEGDTFIKAANAINVDGKIKIMVAIRPYALTARYLMMMCKGFEEIAENRLILNIIAGTFDDSQKLFCPASSLEQRKKDAGIFVQRLKENNLNIKNFPTIAFSGSSLSTLENVKNFGDMNISMLSDFHKYFNQYEMIKNKRIMVKLWINMSNNFNNISNIREKNNTIYGDADSIKKQILELQKIGITDILISQSTLDDNDIAIHNLVKEMSNK